MCEKKKRKLHYISYTNFLFEVIIIHFWQIWHFDFKDTRWLSLQLTVASFWCKLWKAQYMSAPLREVTVV